MTTDPFHKAQKGGVVITKLGKLPGNEEHTGKCNHCKTEVKFKREAAKYHNDQRDGDYLEVACPLCSNPITTSVRGGRQP
ncbi:DNA-directed RNA polymerase subunit RPC12/RpoP [Neorhizobium huautlense]|uniref:DNA-directed RNA polymerase subunit RPC12/RpoP n=1 Tax=Neorhizobium huautlense TaxID=67774 RepID=A0ABT9PV24_9HYPH|nr:hypothetical protein [Neorhizobium huautlense]MDP9837564.1 DNA-directed RNA polymerase subunit RPC12/RpoP [Neorhizobium huautlense]